MRAARVTLEELRELLGRDPTRAEIRRLEVLATFGGFDTGEVLDRTQYRFDLRRGRRPRSRKKRPRTRYGLRHRPDCLGARPAPRSDNGGKRCLGCVLAARQARAKVATRQRCDVCSRYVTTTPNRRRTCSEVCRYRLMASTRRMAGKPVETCKRGHRAMRARADGYQECRTCRADGQRARRAQ